VRHLRAWFLVFFVAAAGAAVPAATEQSVRQLWQLLDYVSVDYAGAVANGQVTKSSEYA
jgi:high-affinity iron transporter